MTVQVSLTPASAADREDAAAFAGRLTRWDPMTPIRLRRDDTTVRLWAGTPFDVLVTRSMRGLLTPADVTVRSGNLLAALAVSTDSDVDPGPAADLAWHGPLPPLGGWVVVERIPAEVIAGVARDGVTAARDRPGPHGGTSAAVLDAEALSADGAGYRVSIPMRMLFALSGMGFAPTSGADSGSAQDADLLRISATDAWVRIDGPYGAVVRRRQALLPLLF